MNQKIAPLGPLPAIRQLNMLPARAPFAGAGRLREASSAAAGTRLSLTGDAARLQALQHKLAAAPAVDCARVVSLRAEMARGEYQVKPELIAERMLEMGKQLGR